VPECAFCGSTKAKLAPPNDDGQRLCENQGACEGRRKIRIAESQAQLREQATTNAA
jgi:hypothetical protein